MEQALTGSSDPMASVRASLEKPMARQVLALAWPMLLYQLLVFLVRVSDRLLAGWFHKEITYQAAQTTAQYLEWCISSYTVLVSAGATALVARFVGAADREAAVRATNQAMLIAVAFGLLG